MKKIPTVIGIVLIIVFLFFVHMYFSHGMSPKREGLQFISVYGLLILVAETVYLFFIRKEGEYWIDQSKKIRTLIATLAPIIGFFLTYFYIKTNFGPIDKDLIDRCRHEDWGFGGISCTGEASYAWHQLEHTWKIWIFAIIFIGLIEVLIFVKKKEQSPPSP